MSFWLFHIRDNNLNGVNKSKIVLEQWLDSAWLNYKQIDFLFIYFLLTRVYFIQHVCSTGFPWISTLGIQMIIIYLLYWVPLGNAIHITNLDFLIKLFDKYFELLLSGTTHQMNRQLICHHKMCLNSSIVHSWMLIQMDSKYFHTISISNLVKSVKAIGTFSCFICSKHTVHAEREHY